MIWEIRKKYLGKTEKKSLYYDYMYFFEAFIDAHGMFASELGYRDFDKYLWSYGKEKGFSMEWSLIQLCILPLSLKILTVIANAQYFSL